MRLGGCGRPAHTLVIPSYTRAMKTAISMPDEVYEQVNDYARRHALSRSEVFVIAARELLDAESRADLTARINEALFNADPGPDAEFMQEAARRTFEANEW